MVLSNTWDQVRVGVLHIAPANITKYTKLYAVLDAAHLKFFQSEAHTGMEKGLVQEILIQDVTDVELVRQSNRAAYSNDAKIAI